MKGLIFLCCSCAILIFSIINLCIAPIISRKTTNMIISAGIGSDTVSTRGDDWGTYNCAILSDYYDEYKKSHTLSDKQKKYSYEHPIKECQRKKAMHNMEYTSFVFDIVIGFVCGLLGLLHYFNAKKEFVHKTGLIGTGCGIVGFVLTFVYVIYNGIVYTKYYDTTTYKTDSDGAFAKLTSSGKYECLYYDDDPLNIYSYYAKYSDLIKKQYNYIKDWESSIDINCKRSPSVCVGRDSLLGPITDTKGKDCSYLYTTTSYPNFTYKDKSQRFLTALILSLFICLSNIGLALFGFMLFRKPEEF